MSTPPAPRVWALLAFVLVFLSLLLSPSSASISDATWEVHSQHLDAGAPAVAAGGVGSSLFPHVISSDDLQPSDDEWDDPDSIKHIMQATGGGASTGGNLLTGLTLNLVSYNVSQCIPAPVLLTPPIQFLSANSTTGSVNVTLSLTGIPTLNHGLFGSLTLQSVQSSSITLAANSTAVNQVTPINFVASSLTAANAALASLTYTPAQGLQDVANEVAIQVSAFLTATPSVSQLSAYVISFSQLSSYSPLVIVPIDYQSFSNLTAPGNTTIHIPAIQVVDLANPNDELAVVISPLNGYVTVSNTSNLVFQPNPYINTINFAGHLADVNNALASLVWTSVCPSLGGCTSSAYGGFTLYVRDFVNNTECPAIAILDCTLDQSPNGLSIIEAALPPPFAYQVANSSAWNVTWMTLQQAGWVNTGFTSDPTAYALLISSDPTTQGFAQVYYGLGTSFLLTNLTAGTTYTVEVEIYSAAGLTTCPGYISQQTGRSVCAPNPFTFTTGGSRPGGAFATLLGSTSSSLNFTTAPPAGGDVDGLVVSVFQGNASTGLTSLSSPFVVIPVQVAGGAVVEVVTGLSPFTPYTIVVQARNSAGLGPAFSFNAWTLLQGPAIIGFVASDPTNLNTAVQSGDVLTLTFDMDTNQPLVSSKQAIDALLSFSQPIAADYTGVWQSASVLLITLTSVTSQSPVVGVESVAVIGQLRSADLVSDVSSSTATLTGNWGTFGLAPYFTLPATAVTLQENAEAYLEVSTNFPASLLSDAGTVYVMSVQILQPVLAGASLSGGAAWSSKGALISANGTASALQSVLSSVLYGAPAGYFGSASFQYSLTLSASSTLVAELVQVVQITHSNHLPILVAPETVQLTLEQWTAVPSISVSDVDVQLGSVKDSMMLLVSASEGGSLSWSGAASVGVQYAPSFSGSSPIFQLTGPMLAINLALQQLQARFEYDTVTPAAALQPFVLLSVNDHGNGGQPALSNAQHVYVDLACPADQSQVLATTVTAAQLSSTGNELLVSLSLPVSASVLSSPFFDCSSVFSAASVQLFGSSPACHWVSSSALQVELGVGATVAPSSALQVSANAFARCGGVATSSPAATVIVLAPQSAAMSNVAISGPSMASLCEDLTLTAVTFASSSHALHYSWTMPSGFILVDAASSISLSSPSLTVPAALFSSFTSQPTYTFQLTVTDYLNLSHSASFDVEMDHTAKPLIQPLTPTSLAVRVEDELDLHAVVSLPSCDAAPAALLSASSSPAVSFSWTVTPAVSGVVLGSASSLHLPAGVLSYAANAQHAYTFTLTASMADNANLLSIQQFTVTVLPSDLHARIAGGRTVTVQPTAAVSVDASTSYDADAAGSVAASSEYSWQWSCTPAAPLGADSASACYGTDGTPLTMSNSPLLSFSAGLLSTNAFTFTLLLTHIPSGRTSTASQTVQVTEPYTTAVALALNVAPLVINAGDKLALSAQASAAASFTWSITGSGAAHSVLTLPTAFNASSLSALVLNAGQSASFFEFGTTYAVRSTAVSSAGDASTATVSVYVNAPPTCSQPLSVISSAGSNVGVALETAYVLSIPSSSCWDVDAEQEDVLLYQFFRKDALSGLYFWLSAASPVSATSELVLPQGAAVQVGVRVLDRLGGYSEYSTQLAVGATSTPLSASSLLSAYSVQTASALQNGDGVAIAATIGSLLSTASSASALSSDDLLQLKDSLLTDLLTFASALPDDYITPVLATLVQDPASTSVSAAKYALTFVAALSAGDSMAASVNQLQAVVATLNGLVARIGAGQASSGGGSRRRLLAGGSSQALDAATLNALNSELFASLNSLSVDVSTQLLSVEGDRMPISAPLLSGSVQRGLIGGSPFAVSVFGSTLTVPSTSALSSVAPVGSAFDVAVIRTPSASFEYVQQVGQVSEVYFVGAYAAASYFSPLAPHTSTSSLVSALSASTFANATVTFDVAYNATTAGSCLNSVNSLTGLVCSLECRQWNGTAFSAAAISTDFLALNTQTNTARCVLSQPGVVSLFQATESSAVLAAASTGASSTAGSSDQSAAVRASVTFPAPFTIVNMKDFKQGLVQDLASASGQPASRFNIEQVTTNSQNGLTTVIVDIWVPTDASQANSQSVYLQLAALSTTAVLTTSYLRYADLSSWLEQCADLVFRATCSSSPSSSSGWQLPLIIAASAAGFLLLCALTVLAVRRFYSAPAKDDKTLEDFTLPSAGGVAKQYIYSPPTAGKELDAEMSKHDQVSDVTIVAGNSGIDPHTASQSHAGAGDEEISEPVIVESEAEAAELAARSDLHSAQSRTAGSSLPADFEDEEKELSMTRGSVSGQSRHFYYVDDSVKGSVTEVSTTSNSLSSRSSTASAPTTSTTTRAPRQSVSQANAAPVSKSHFRVSAGGAPAADDARERSTSASLSSRSTTPSAAGRSTSGAHFRYSDNEAAQEASTSRTPSLPHLPPSPSHSATASELAPADGSAFHTFSHLDLDPTTAQPQQVAAEKKKAIKVIRPGQH